MYLDSSIIVKLLTPEPDSEHYIALVDGQPSASLELAYTEVFSALLAKERNGRITFEARQAAWTGFTRQVNSAELKLLPADSTSFRKAQQMMQSCHPAVPLRSLDALHLAACDLAQDFPLVTNDARMMAAAQRLGIPVL
ncbi:MAG: type II toxin-antitoxin system VapC family toxin [Methylacidiphilales bacterium]|nr:type II toxin-antitoxin system VapC family toxin [Candidatus Methylacidiphilales bacterium]